MVFLLLNNHNPENVYEFPKACPFPSYINDVCGGQLQGKTVSFLHIDFGG